PFGGRANMFARLVKYPEKLVDVRRPQKSPEKPPLRPNTPKTDRLWIIRSTMRVATGTASASMVFCFEADRAANPEPATPGKSAVGGRVAIPYPNVRPASQYRCEAKARSARVATSWPVPWGHSWVELIGQVAVPKAMRSVATRATVRPVTLVSR